MPGFRAPIVYLQHGLDESSISWVMNSVDKAPAFILSRAGYDVWIGNSRGNIFSQNHIKFQKENEEFWNFDFE